MLWALVATTTFASNTLSNTTWSLTSYNGTAASGTLSFDETTMLSKFCNNVRQWYSLSGSTLFSNGVAMSTMMYCQGMPMTRENNFALASTGTPLVLSGETLTITTNNNTYSFTKNLVKLNNLVSQCIQAYDECGNMCHRAAWTTGWSCTKMACAVQKDAQCIMSTNDEPLTVCTMDYNPVCGAKQVQCIKAPCDPVQQTYGNLCTLSADKATLLYTGECKDNLTIVWNDKDTHGCIGSAWYSWSQSQGVCVKVWEYQANGLEKAYDLAYNHGITSMDSIKRFRADDFITRQEAAKMFNAMAENLFAMSYASFPDECNVPYSDEHTFDPTLKNHIYGACALGLMKWWSQRKFAPYGNLTRSQALVVLMRAVDGRQDTEKTSNPRWMPYAERAQKLWYMTSSTFEGRDPITRGELIEWIHTIYLKKINSK